jgi:hypothetical protein
MDALGLLEEIASVFAEKKLEVILVGNAAAALQGAPVTTDDFDFMWRPTRRNLMKLKEVAQALGGSVSQPEYPLSRFYRITSSSGIWVDMMGVMDGIKSFESLRSRASAISLGRVNLVVADLRDVIMSKRAANRPKDVAALPVLEETLMHKRKS